MNLYVGVVSLILCTFVGFRLASKYSDRKRFFVDFYNFNEKMINEVSFTNKSILNITNQNGVYNDCFNELLRKKIINEKLVMPNYLKNDDVILFNEYGETVGKTDRDSQLKFLTAKRQELLKINAICEVEEKKYKKLYVKLGFLFGLIILIISF